MIDEFSETVPQWFSTHPSHKNRMGTLEQQLPSVLKIRDDCKASDDISECHITLILICDFI